MANPEKNYIETEESGQRVVCNGTGRNWVSDYRGKAGVILGRHTLMSGFLVRLDCGEEMAFYLDEIDVESSK